MLIDAFTFYNEYDMLECRLEYLFNEVDYFIISECNYTHTGKEKELNFLVNRERYKRFLDKIIYMPFIVTDEQYNNYKFGSNTGTDRDMDTPCWRIEKAQRNFISYGVRHFSDDSLVMVSDVDEVPNKDKFPEMFYAMTHPDTNFEYMALVQNVHVFNLKYFNDNGPWWAACVAKKKDLVRLTPDWLRMNARYHRAMRNAGWHMTYFMDPDLVKNKIENMAHQELNQEQFKNRDWLEECISSGKNLFGHDIKMNIAAKEDFPENFMKVFNRFYPQ